jgi:hypothetical protein
MNIGFTGEGPTDYLNRVYAYDQQVSLINVAVALSATATFFLQQQHILIQWR